MLFLSKSLEAIYCLKRADAWNAKSNPGVHEGVDVGTIFLDNQIFLPMALLYARVARASAPLEPSFHKLFKLIAILHLIWRSEQV